MSAALELDGVWKSYPDWSGSPRTLRGTVARRVPALRGRDAPRRWALRDVTVKLAEGQSLGLVGHNGAGKSTLLRLASGLGRPSRGRLQAHPDTASVLNLGSSFDLQLTGRENAFTTALVAGLTRRAARAALPRMLEFSELGDFADSPIRTYSEGMKLRLAFSLMAELQPRLLILDEVLAVGDLSFRIKCQERISELQSGGTSLVLASHSATEIATTCTHAVWLHRGEVRASGDAEAVLAAYESAVHDETMARTPVGSARDEGPLRLGDNRFGSQEVTLDTVRFGGTTGDARLTSGDALRLTLAFTTRGEPVDDPALAVSIRRRSDDAVLVNLTSRDGGLQLGRGLRSGTVELAIERLDLPAGDYAVDAGIWERSWEHAYDYHRAAYALRIDGPTGGKGLLAPPHRWSRRD